MSNPFPLKNHSISSEHAAEMTKRFRENKHAVIAAGFPEDTLAFRETFSRESVVKLLSSPEAVSFRIYYGMSVDLKVHAILVAADKDGRDILPVSNSNMRITNSANAGEDENNEILEDGYRCPTLCPPPSELNN